MTFRDIADGIAKFIEQDQVLHDDGNVTVVVEDRGDFGFQIQQALGQLGVCVTVAIASFSRVDNSPILQGKVELQISTYEHPALNRSDPALLTAQGAMERIVRILHGRRFPFLANRMLFGGLRRDDTDEVNIVRGDFSANTLLNFEQTVATESTPTTTKEE
jgi:hypothetical protein